MPQRTRRTRTCPEPIGALTEARAAAEEYARLACTPMSTNDPGLMWATLAVASELRALTLILEDAWTKIASGPAMTAATHLCWVEADPDDGTPNHYRPCPADLCEATHLHKRK